MEQFIYARLNNKFYCVGISQLSGEVIQDNMVRIEEYDLSYLNRKYDIISQKWTDEYKTYEKSAIEPSTEPTQLDIIQANTDYIVMMME